MTRRATLLHRAMLWGSELGPLLLGVLIASGAGGWLATHGFLLGGAAVMVVAAVLAVRAWMRVRRRMNDG